MTASERHEPGGWGRAGIRFGVVVASSLAGATGLYLVDVLGDAPDLQATAAGFERDLATYYAAWFARQRTVIWNIALRESLLLLAFAALTMLMVRAGTNFGRRRPSVAVTTTAFGFGAVLHSAADFVYLGNAAVWRKTGWAADPASNMIVAAPPRQSGLCPTHSRLPVTCCSSMHSWGSSRPSGPPATQRCALQRWPWL